MLFGVALALTPDQRGYGTHEQLGLPPYSFKSAFGYPCPHCGMTTSFSLLVRGRLGAAAQANPSGILLGSLLILLVPWSFGTCWTGRWLVTNDPLLWFVRGSVSYVVVTIVLWTLRTFL